MIDGDVKIGARYRHGLPAGLRADGPQQRMVLHDDGDVGSAPATDERHGSSAGSDVAAKCRDEEAITRDGMADSRDRMADARDRKERADDLTSAEAGGDTSTDRALRTRAAEARGRAAVDREHAALDRKLGNGDREHSAGDRASARLSHEAMAEELREAGIDELTGARRRGPGLVDAEREVERARRTKASLVAAFVDVNDLKSVNDRDGHRAGDQVLCEVVAALKRAMRSYDLVVRLGGDEFLCLMSDLTLLQVGQRFDALRTAAQQRGTSGGRFEAGFGRLLADQSLTQLIDVADRDLLLRRSRRNA